MSRVAVIATIVVPPGARADVVEIILRHRERCLRDEPGTLKFEVMMPSEDETRVMLYEVYQSQAAFEAHWNGPSLALCRDEAGERMTIVSGLWGTPVS